MSYVNWVEIYTSYTAEELTNEIADLKKRIKGGYTGQSAGGKSYTRDTSLLQAQLQAAVRVQNQRAGQPGRGEFVGVADFSGGVDGGSPRSSDTFGA